MIMNTTNIKFVYHKFDFFRINNISNEMRLGVIVSVARNKRKNMVLSIGKMTMIV